MVLRFRTPIVPGPGKTIMKIKIIDIPDEGLEFSRVGVHVNLEPVQVTSENIQGPVMFSGKIERVQKGFIVKGHFSGAWVMSCARCLETITIPATDTFRIFMSPRFNDAKGKLFNLAMEDLDESELVGDEIDMEAVLREQMILQLPMKPICFPDCRGLCPQCGQNLNKKECNCSTPTTNPGLVKLKQLLEK
jgi:uncharacterized protein